MGEPTQPLRPVRAPRWLALPMAAASLALLLWALAGFLRLAVTARPSGTSAGGAALLAERCRRGVPEDLAAACIEASTRREVAAAARLGAGAALGVGLLVFAIRVDRKTRCSRSSGRRAA